MTLAWHPWSGCSPISPSCANCHLVQHRELGELVDTLPNGGSVYNGTLRFNEDQIAFPNALKTGSIILVLPHGDLFHENAPAEWLDRVFTVMETDNRHVYQILTKRSVRMLEYLQERYAGSSAPPHLAIGVSMEMQREANRRIPDLLNAPAQFKFLTFFALLERIDISLIPGADDFELRPIRQVMLGGGVADPSANIDWYEEIRKHFELLRIPVSSHVYVDEVEKRGF